MIGVVLMGGESSRMGRDKSFILIQQIPQHQRVASLLSNVCDSVYYSINPKQRSLSLPNCILDEYDKIGPLGGIASSLKALQSTILFVAIDLPLLHSEDLTHLEQHHQSQNGITAYQRQDKDRTIWEGLVSIWEPSVLSDLTAFVEEGGRSVQQFLNQIQAKPISVLDEKRFLNINRPEDMVGMSL